MTQFYDQNRTPVDFDQINPVMYDAMLSSEDPRYYQHGGIDLIGTTRALLSNAAGRRRDPGRLVDQPAVREERARPAVRANATAEATEERTTRTSRVGPDRPRTAGPRRHGRDRGHTAQAAGDALRDRPRAEVLQERHPARLPQHRQLRRHHLRHRGRGPLLLQHHRERTSRVAQAATLAGIVQNPNTYRIDKAGGIDHRRRRERRTTRHRTA